MKSISLVGDEPWIVQKCLRDGIGPSSLGRVGLVLGLGPVGRGSTRPARAESWPSGSLPLSGIDGDWQRRQRGVARGIRCGGNLGARCQDGNEDRLGVGCQQTKHTPEA